MGSEAESNRKKSDQRLQGGAVFFFFFHSSLLGMKGGRRRLVRSALGESMLAWEELGGARGAYSMYRKSSSQPWRNKIST